MGLSAQLCLAPAVILPAASPCEVYSHDMPSDAPNIISHLTDAIFTSAAKAAADPGQKRTVLVLAQKTRRTHSITLNSRDDKCIRHTPRRRCCHCMPSPHTTTSVRLSASWRGTSVLEFPPLCFSSFV
ncbi:hypothetical protein BDW22DRAFT_174400 [Trametopsis cervina]|nr:hypothetical protein BDW22DRAFT_174400 [Trametopsis cervina]